MVELRYSMAPVAAAASRRLSAEYVAISVLRETVAFVASRVASPCLLERRANLRKLVVCGWLWGAGNLSFASFFSNATLRLQLRRQPILPSPQTNLPDDAIWVSLRCWWSSFHC